MSNSFLILKRIGIFLSSVFIAGVSTIVAQETGPTAQATANAGMTSGLPGGASATGRQIEMMQVRNSAQQSQSQVAAAQMARSADVAIEERNQKKAIDYARETKRLKKDATNRMKWERSANAYSKVSADQMSTWKDRSGNVRVERNVPNEFLLALRQEESAMAAELQQKEKRGFHPLRATKKAIGSVPIPFQKNKATAYEGGRMNTSSTQALPESGEGKKGGFKLRPPKLPFGGGGRSEKITNAKIAKANAATQPAQTAQAGGSQVGATTGVVGPGRIPQISGAELVDGRSSIGRGEPSSSVSAYKGQPGEYGEAATQAAMTEAPMPSQKAEKKGLFGSRKSSGPSRSGGGFSFGKKKSKPADRGTVDASLFPAGAASHAPSGGELSSGASSTDVVAMQTGATEVVVLPGQSAERKPRRKFSMPKPSIPSLSKAAGGGSKKSTDPLTTINANGNDYYHVANQAQFMRYGSSQMESEITTIPAGVLLRMTKPGAEWASVEMSDGTKGVIQVKNLQGASSGSIPAQFGAPAPSN